MSRAQFIHSYHDITSVESLLEAWGEFLVGKRSRRDVQEFERNLMDNVLALHAALQDKTYEHSGYEAFHIADPKPRHIHKATVRDRLVHHAIYRGLYPFFDKCFIYDSYSCRNDKGTHRALNRFRAFARVASCNHTRTCWVLKCDIKKFFASVDQNILMEIIQSRIPDPNTVWLIGQVVSSFYSTEPGKGLPLGNLTSQLLVNVYMNEFDQFMKHKLKAKYYIRYADDFVILSHDKTWLQSLLPQVQEFLSKELRLTLHPNKVSITTVASGVDYLGWVHFTDHRVLRAVTKRRVLRGIKQSGSKPEVVQSYLGLLKHGNAWKIRKGVEEAVLVALG